jgi:hypothetical protein
MDVDTTAIFLRIWVTMAAIGVTMGVASWLSYEWLVEISLLAPAQAEAVLPVYPVIILLVVVVSAPLLAGIMGIFEGLRGSSSDRLIVTVATSLVSGLTMVMLAALFIGQINPPGNAAVVELGDALTVGGLSGIASALSSAICTMMNTR